MSDPNPGKKASAPESFTDKAKTQTREKLDEIKEKVDSKSHVSEMVQNLLKNFDKMDSNERIRAILQIALVATLGKYLASKLKGLSTVVSKEDETNAVTEEESAKTKEEEDIGEETVEEPGEPSAEECIDPAIAGEAASDEKPMCRNTYDEETVMADHQHNARMLEVAPGKMGELEEVLAKYRENKARYEKVAQATGIPPALICAIHYREAFKFDRYLHNGQQLGSPTTYVPKGVLFDKGQWEEAAIHALGGDIVDKNGKPSLERFQNLKEKFGLTADSTDIGAMMAVSEYYNGLGYRRHGVQSCYVYAGTNLNQRGRYVADGKFDPESLDRRLGTAAIIMGIQAMESQKPLRIAGGKKQNINLKSA